MGLLTRSSLRGTWATVLLPVESDNSIDLARLDEELDLLTASGVAGIYTNGTAGEFHAIGEQEYDEVSRIVAGHCSAARVKFQLGASHMSGDISLARIRRSRALEPSGFQVILPDWCPLADGEVVTAVEGLARAAAPFPITLYNPPMAKTRLEPRLFGELAQRVPQLVGIKVAGGDGEWFREMQRFAPDLAIFVPGHLLASGTLRGASGAYSNIACLSPTGAMSWDAMIARSPDAAIALETRINAFIEANILPLKRAGFCDAALDKTLAHIGGWATIGTRTRWPYRYVDPLLAESLRPIARAELPELFEKRGR